jgi:hypothetical protein
MNYKKLLETIMESEKNIRFLLVSDMYGNVVNSKHREGADNYLTEDETKDSLHYSAEAWRIRKEHSAKIGKGKYALVEYEKIFRITVPLTDERLLLVTTDTTEKPYKLVELIMNQISHPKL